MVKLPNADRAVIADEKLCNYLLNLEHRKGGSKAKLLFSLGYRAEEWQRLEQDIQQQHLTADIADSAANDYGVSYSIEAPIQGPSGRIVDFRSIWQIDIGTDDPRLITMYPR